MLCYVLLCFCYVLLCFAIKNPSKPKSGPGTGSRLKATLEIAQALEAALNNKRGLTSQRIRAPQAFFIVFVSFCIACYSFFIIFYMFFITFL